jgi:hypothetical protein
MQVRILAGSKQLTRVELFRVQLTALINVESLQTPAEIAGLFISGAIMAYYVKRALDVTDKTGSEWPGPKASPAGMALVAFFCLNIFIQGLRAS